MASAGHVRDMSRTCPVGVRRPHASEWRPLLPDNAPARAPPARPRPPPPAPAATPTASAAAAHRPNAHCKRAAAAARPTAHSTDSALRAAAPGAAGRLLLASWAACSSVASALAAASLERHGHSKPLPPCGADSRAPTGRPGAAFSRARSASDALHKVRSGYIASQGSKGSGVQTEGSLSNLNLKYCMFSTQCQWVTRVIF